MKCSECERLIHLTDIAYDAFMVARAAQQVESADQETLNAATDVAHVRWQNMLRQKATHDRNSHPQAPRTPV